MTTFAAPECVECRHLHRATGATRNTCDAFPDGIPEPLILGERLHRRPYQGDRGLRFELAATAAPPASAAR